MEHYYPNSAWLRIRQDVFDRLHQYKMQAGMATWEEALEMLAGAGERMTTVEQIADAILYEGYILYPYRASALKNGQRWNFGVLYPPEYAAAQQGSDAATMQCECLARGGTASALRSAFCNW